MTKKKQPDVTAKLSRMTGDPRSIPLPVQLTAGERAVRAQELATVIGEQQRAEDSLEQFVEETRATRKELAAAVSAAQLRVRELARIVRESREERSVSVVDEFDYEAAAVQTVRTDTGEVVGTRGMTEAERQVVLFPTSGGSGDN